MGCTPSLLTNNNNSRNIKNTICESAINACVSPRADDTLPIDPMISTNISTTASIKLPLINNRHISSAKSSAMSQDNSHGTTDSVVNHKNKMKNSYYNRSATRDRNNFEFIEQIVPVTTRCDTSVLRFVDRNGKSRDAGQGSRSPTIFNGTEVTTLNNSSADSSFSRRSTNSRNYSSIANYCNQQNLYGMENNRIRQPNVVVIRYTPDIVNLMQRHNGRQQSVDTNRRMKFGRTVEVAHYDDDSPRGLIIAHRRPSHDSIAWTPRSASRLRPLSHRPSLDNNSTDSAFINSLAERERLAMAKARESDESSSVSDTSSYVVVHRRVRVAWEGGRRHNNASDVHYSNKTNINNNNYHNNNSKNKVERQRNAQRRYGSSKQRSSSHSTSNSSSSSSSASSSSSLLMCQQCNDHSCPRCKLKRMKRNQREPFTTVKQPTTAIRIANGCVLQNADIERIEVIGSDTGTSSDARTSTNRSSQTTKVTMNKQQQLPTKRTAVPVVRRNRIDPRKPNQVASTSYYVRPNSLDAIGRSQLHKTQSVPIN